MREENIFSCIYSFLKSEQHTHRFLISIGQTQLHKQIKSKNIKSGNSQDIKRVKSKYETVLTALDKKYSKLNYKKHQAHYWGIQTMIIYKTNASK